MAEIGVTLFDAVQMAVQQQRAGNTAAAEYICRQILAIDPHQTEALRLLRLLAEAHDKLATDWAAKNDFDRAEAEYARAIELDPTNPRFALNLGTLLRSRGKPAAAIFTFSETIRRFPNFAPAYSARAMVLAEHRLLDDALADQRRAIELVPGEIEPHLQLAKTLSAKGDVAGAEASCRRALELDPGSADAWECLGRVMQTNGQFDEAAAALGRCLEIEPRSAVEMLLAAMGRFEKIKPERLAAKLDDPSLSSRDHVSAGFALGKMLDGQDRFDEAFAAFTNANALFKEQSARRGFRFDVHELRGQVDAVTETFSADFLQVREKWGAPSEVPVFIVGMPRSGTTLVEQIAASHSSVFAAGERFDIAMIRSRLASVEQGDSPHGWNQTVVRQEAESHLRMLAALSSNAGRVIDKMPGNLMDLGTVATLFPRARVIFCSRDARDTCLSCYFQLFSNNDLLFSYDLTDCARQHREYDRLTAHWQSVLPLRMLTVRYEELVADLEGQSRRLIEFLGLAWEPACLAFHETSRPVLTSSFWQVRQPIYTRSVGRWKHYEKHLDSLRTALGENQAR